MSDRSIIVTHQDYLILKKLADSLRTLGPKSQPHIIRFIAEMEKATISDSHTIPPGVVTLRSDVRYTYLDTQRSAKAVIVFPVDLAGNPDNISILSPFGMALIGEREGTIVDYIAPGGKYRLRIDRVKQPVTV